MKKQITLIISALLSIAMMNGQELDRTGWTVTTQTATNYEFVPDGTTGRPQDILDDNPATFLSLVKPGKSFGSIETQPAGIIPSFTIDMQYEQAFDSLKWRHRSTHSYNYLRVYGIMLEGSNSGMETDFTQIGPDTIWIPNAGGYSGSFAVADLNTYAIAIPSSYYRFVRVKPIVWSDVYMGGEHPEYPEAGAKAGSTMQIAEFSLSKSVVNSISNETSKHISIFPTIVNVNQPITIDIDNISVAALTIYTTSGVKVLEQQLSSANNSILMDQKGLFIIEVKSQENTYTSRVIIK
jgi:hypothetical protein